MMQFIAFVQIPPAAAVALPMQFICAANPCSVFVP
jgi:hypothetical protein